MVKSGSGDRIKLKSDRRRQLRSWYFHGRKLRIRDRGRLLNAKVIDSNDHGLGVETSTPMEVNSFVSFVGVGLRGHAKVVHSGRSNQGAYRAGLRLESVSFCKLDVPNRKGTRTNPRKLLITSPDKELLSGLNRSLSRLENPGKAVVLARYPSAEELGRLIADHQPSGLIVGLGDNETALSLIEQARKRYPSLQVACAHTSHVSDMILSGLRAGSREFLVPPVAADLLESLFEGPEEVHTGSGDRGRLICFLPARGGCGGSTVALHVARSIALSSNSKVLFVDFDFHTRTAELWLGLRPDFTLADAVRRRADLHELWHQLTCHSEGLDILAPPQDGFVMQADILCHAMAVFDSARADYDWVICDLPPAVYSSSVRVLAKTEAVYLVTTPELMSLRLARRKVEELINLGISAQAIQLVVNRLGEDGLSLDTAELKEIINVPIASAFPSDYKKLNNAIMKQRLLPESSKLGKAFGDFATQIARPASAEHETPTTASQLSSLLSHLVPGRPDASQTAQNPLGLASS